MVSELLNRTAIKWFEEESWYYDVVSDDIVTIRMPLSHDIGVHEVQIIDHGNRNGEVGPLSISVSEFVRFADGQRSTAEAMCNTLSRRVFGKFVVDEFVDVTYSLNCPFADTAGPSDFASAFFLAVNPVALFYPQIMRVRWANRTIEQALAEEEADETAPRTFSNEEIADLLAVADRTLEAEGEEGLDEGDCLGDEADREEC